MQENVKNIRCLFVVKNVMSSFQIKSVEIAGFLLKPWTNYESTGPWTQIHKSPFTHPAQEQDPDLKRHKTTILCLFCGRFVSLLVFQCLIVILCLFCGRFLSLCDHFASLGVLFLCVCVSLSVTFCR